MKNQAFLSILTALLFMGVANAQSVVSTTQVADFGSITSEAEGYNDAPTFDEETGILTLRGKVNAEAVQIYRNSDVTYIVCEPGTMLPPDASTLFEGFAKVVSIDLRNADVSNVEYMTRMFNLCNKLESIYVNSSWSIPNVIESDEMFGQCRLLKGGNGTEYKNYNANDASFAIVDGKDGISGYLSIKPNVTSAPIAKTLSYSGYYQECILPGSVDHGAMVYSLSRTDKYYTFVPSILNAGTYTVFYKHEGAANQEAQSIEVTMTKAPLIIKAKDKTVPYGENLLGYYMSFTTNEYIGFAGTPYGDIEYEGLLGSDNAFSLNAEIEDCVKLAFNYKQGDPTGEYTITPSGVSSDNYDITFVDGTLTVEPKKLEHHAAVSIEKDQNGKHAVIDGNYDLDGDFHIDDDIVVQNVEFRRKFPTGEKGFSTLLLPFRINTKKLSGVKAVFAFDSIADCSEIKDGKEDVCVSVLWADTSHNYSNMEANTPYMIQMNDPTLGFNLGDNEFVILEAFPYNPYEDYQGPMVTDPKSGWQFRGSYKYKVWSCDEKEDQDNESLGRIWGYAAAPQNGFKIGQYAQFGPMASVKPFRAYLYNPNGEALDYCKNQTSAPAPKAYAAKPSIANNEIASNNEGMDVIIVTHNENSEDYTTVIGRMDTHTGEIRSIRSNTFDLKGRNVGRKKNAKGMYLKK